MANALAMAAAAAAIVFIGAGGYLAGGLEAEPAGSFAGTEPRFGQAAAPAAPQPPGSPAASAWSPSMAAAAPRSDAPRELDELLWQSRLDEAWLHAHGFSSGAALQRLHALLDARTSVPGEPRVQLQARPSGASEGEGGGVPRLAAGERYVLATLASAPATGDDSVLLRWRRTSDDTVMELSAQALPAAGEPLQLWMHTAQDWVPGSYRLEVISANPRLEPLAAAEFEIAAPGVPVTAFSYPLGSAAQR